MASLVGVVFNLTTLLKFIVVSACVWWPLNQTGCFEGEQSCLHDIRFHQLVANSNLDVWSISILQTIVLLALLHKAAVAKKATRLRPTYQPDPFKQASRGVSYSSVLFQLLLLSKAVTVAILGDGDGMPTRRKPSNAGLACLFGTLVTSLIASFIESYTCSTLIERWQAEYEDKMEGGATADGSEAGQPLLGHSKREEMQQAQQRKKEATIGALLRLSAPDSPVLFLAFAAGAIAALGQALVPYYTGKIIDYASIDPCPNKFKSTTLKLLAVAFLCAIFTGIRGGLFTVCMTRLNIRLRKKLFNSLVNQDIGFFDSTKTGEITSRLSADTTTVSDQICLNLNVMFRSAAQAAVVLIFMFTACWRLTVVTFVMVPVVLAICKAYGGYYRKLSKKVQTELASANSVAEEALSSMTTVRSHAAEGSCEAAYANKLTAFHTLQNKEALAYSLYMTTNTFLSAAVVAGVLFYGGSLVLEGAMSAGALVSFMLYQASLSGSFQALGDVFSALSAAVGAADKVIELMNRPPDFKNVGDLAPTTFNGKLELRGVDFSYPARPHATVLSGFNLTISPGEVVALVGPSGGGKSSVVKLLERFYLPTAGQVLFDDRDVGMYESGWLRRRVALVSQEPVLYARSIKRNIVYGLEAEDGVPQDEIPTDADVEEAAKLANAHDFISALPDGYETECGERGMQLSGGQKQRIAIARALVRRPAVLLLDEATSALDADSEAVVQEALDATMRGRTVLVIAHRLSTVQNATKIAVVRGGGVVEVGTHEELLDREGSHYAALVRRQLARTTSSMALAPSASQSSIV